VLVEEHAKGRIATGILTDRDIVSALAVDPSGLRQMTVGRAITGKLHSATPDEDFFEVLVRMRGHGVRRFPVVDRDGVLQGIIAFDDLLEFVAEQLSRLSALIEREQVKEREAFVSQAVHAEPPVNHGHLKWR
jgi:signal-transduction protein with cAMP-binding, CBS, and nucleotidyltransferase domain